MDYGHSTVVEPAVWAFQFPLVSPLGDRNFILQSLFVCFHLSEWQSNTSQFSINASLLQVDNFIHYTEQQSHQHTLYEKGQKVRGQMKVKEMTGNAADNVEETTQLKANTSSLTTSQVDAVKEVGCSLTISQTLNPKQKQTQLEPSAFSESSDKEDGGRAGINQTLQREVIQKRDTKQAQQVMMEDPTMCEFDEVFDGIEEGRKMAVAAKLGELKPHSSGGQQNRIN